MRTVSHQPWKAEVILGVSQLRTALTLAVALLAMQGLTPLHGQSWSDPTVDPTGTAGALKAKVETGGGYDPHSGNASRSVTDLRVPGAAGAYGLDFTRHWNSTRSDVSGVSDNYPVLPFASGGWTHSWNLVASLDFEESESDVYPMQGVVTVKCVIKAQLSDGSTAEFHFSRNTQNYAGDLYAPPFPATWAGHRGVATRLREMASDGSNFWLYLGDGGSMHFTRLGQSYLYVATELFDPHGFRTQLDYNAAGQLTRVSSQEGRELRFAWKTPAPANYQVLGSVESGVGAGLQKVTFSYTHYPHNGFNWHALTKVIYEGDFNPHDLTLPPNTPYSATYWYAPHISVDSGGATRGRGPVLTQADDPRVAGVMTKIKYQLRGGPGGGELCPKNTENPQTAGLWQPDFFYPTAFPLEQELSANTGLSISGLTIPCNGPSAGSRIEWRGAGGQRRFSYGHFAGTEPGSSSAYGGSQGYQLVKVTDFADDAAAAGTPFEFQGFYQDYPKRIFDARGTLSEIIRTPSATNPNEHDLSGRISEVRNVGSDGSKRLYDWSNPGTSEACSTSLIRNTFNHWLFSQTDENNNKTVYTRDSRRRIKRIDHPGGSFEEFTYNDFNNEIKTHKLPSGAIQTYEYNAGGLLEREWNSIDGWDARKEYWYDAFERVREMQDGRARSHGTFTVKLTYNARHQVLTEEYPPTNGVPSPTKEYRYDRYGNCTAIKNELGAWSSYTYDEYRRCTSYNEPLNAPNWNNSGTVASRTWNWIYDRWHEPSQSLRDASTHTSKQWRVQVEPAFNAAGDRRLSARKFDYSDRIIEEVTGMIERTNGDWAGTADTEVRGFTYDANGNKSTYTDPFNRLTTYEYDSRDRLTKTTEPLSRTTTTLYDVTSNKTKVTFPDGKTQQWLDYDAFGQAGRFIDERNNTTNLIYWSWGPMKKLYRVTTHRDKDAGGTEDQLTTFSYDLIGRPIRTDFPDPDQSYEASTYQFGQLKTWRTREGQIKTIVYDARGREISHTWGDPNTPCNPSVDSSATPCVTRTWDDASRLLTLRNKFSSIDYTYDDAGQVLTEGNTIAGASAGRRDTTYWRYPNGAPAHITYPNGWRGRRDYTARGQLQTTGQDNASGVWTYKLGEYTYWKDGKVKTETAYNGVQTNYGYDGRGQIRATDTFRASTTPTQRYSYRTYTRDTRDRILAWYKSNSPTYNVLENGRGDRYGYDFEGQLTAASYEALTPAGTPTGAKRTESFVYDALGNRKGVNVVAGRGAVTFYRTDNGLNQYTSWTPSIINYDDDVYGPPGNGVLMQEGNITAFYNALNQPTTIFGGTLSAGMNFGFDPLGRCVKRWVSASGAATTNPATYFYYDGWNLIQEGTGAAAAERIYLQGNQVDRIVCHYNYAGGGWRYHHYDARGHCILLTDPSGNLIEQYEYDAFGKPYFFNGSGTSLPNGSAVGNRFLFTGREWLSDLKLYDYRKRLYQPELGRFLQPDPKHFKAGDYNLYRYCHNDPINKTDPMGLDTFALGIGVNGAFGFDFRASLQLAVQTGPNGLSLGYIGSIQPLTGLSTGIGASVSAVGTFSKATLSEISGTTGNFGASAALGASVGYDVGNVGSTKEDGTPANVTHNVSIGVGLKPTALVAPAEGHAGASFTKAAVFKKNEDVLEKKK